jgi:hypothetical protein
LNDGVESLSFLKENREIFVVFYTIVNKKIKISIIFPTLLYGNQVKTLLVKYWSREIDPSIRSQITVAYLQVV